VVTLAIWGEVTTGTTLTKCGLWGDMVDVITCAIFSDCRLRGVGMVRGANFPSPIDLITLVTLPCDRVIVYSRLDRGMPYTISDGDVMAF